MSEKSSKWSNVVQWAAAVVVGAAAVAFASSFVIPWFTGSDAAVRKKLALRLYDCRRVSLTGKLVTLNGRTWRFKMLLDRSSVSELGEPTVRVSIPVHGRIWWYVSSDQCKKENCTCASKEEMLFENLGKEQACLEEFILGSWDRKLKVFKLKSQFMTEVRGFLSKGEYELKVNHDKELTVSGHRVNFSEDSDTCNTGTMTAQVTEYEAHHVDDKLNETELLSIQEEDADAEIELYEHKGELFAQFEEEFMRQTVV